jgi:uncharacterized protein
MEQRISFITIGVRHLEQMRDWYITHFGWKPLKDSDGICFFKLNGCIFGLYHADALAEDIGISNDGDGFKRVTLAINMRSKEQVDDVFASLRASGVRIIREPEHVFWGGYRGYLADPEENYWELAFNPFLDMDDNGDVITHT